MSEYAARVVKALADAQHVIQRSQALVALNEALRDALAETLDLCHRNHLVHESLRWQGSTLRRMAREPISEV